MDKKINAANPSAKSPHRILFHKAPESQASPMQKISPARLRAVRIAGSDSSSFKLTFAAEAFHWASPSAARARAQAKIHKKLAMT